MEKNVGLISLNNGGTMGHMVALTSLAKELTRKFPQKQFYIISEYDYKSYSPIQGKNINYIQIPQQMHKKSGAGCIEYSSQESIFNIVKENNVKILIFSTFFDPKLIKEVRKEGVKCILVNNPLRDTHKEIFTYQKFSSLFDRIYILKDFIRNKGNGKMVSPLLRFHPTKKRKESFTILVTCGGGGRPSAENFFELVLPVLKKILAENKNINVIISKGQSKELDLIPAKIVSWIKDIELDLQNADLLISEAGYFTLLDCVSTGTPAVLIPGDRRIDNQELRALEFEKKKCGFFVFHYEEELFYERLSHLIHNQQKLKEFRKNLLSLRKQYMAQKNIVYYLTKEIRIL